MLAISKLIAECKIDHRDFDRGARRVAADVERVRRVLAPMLQPPRLSDQYDAARARMQSDGRD